jgi:hypothetical protein
LECAVSATKEDPDERFARVCVERIEGVQLSRQDLPGRDGAVDYYIHYSDGPAALEITTLADAAYRQVRSEIAKSLLVNPERFSWRFRLTAALSVKCARRYIPQLVEMCELAGVQDPFDLPDRDDPAVLWHEVNSVSLQGYETHRTPTLHVLDPIIGGGVEDPLLELVQAVNDAVSSPLVKRKLEKLRASGLNGRHLFLLVDAQGMDFRPCYGVAMMEEIPTVDPEVPDDASRLWMASGFKLGGVLRWTRTTGWSRHWPYDD